MIEIPSGVDLHKDARPDDQFELWYKPLKMEVYGSPYAYQQITWSSDLGVYFTVCIAGYVTRWYSGSAKIDGTRTRMFWAGQLGGTPEESWKDYYVVNKWAKELTSFRISTSKLDCYRWDNCGGI